MVSSRISAILSEILDLKTNSTPRRVHILGTSCASQAYFLTQTLKTLQETLKPLSTLIILSPDDEQSIELQSYFDALSPIFLAKPVKSIFLPSWEQSPYSAIAPSIQTRFQRLRALSQVLQGNPQGLQIIFCSPPAAFQATLSPEKFKEYSLLLEKGQSIESTTILTKKLILSGYHRLDSVEDPGSFAIRGDIIDIFPPDRPLPLRIDLFGDEVEEIREYDPETQRTYAANSPDKIEQILIPPAREVLVQSMTESLLKERIKARADDRGIPRSFRDPIISNIQNHYYSDHSDTWAPFAYSDPSCFWDYTPKECLVFWNHYFQCTQYWNHWKNNQINLAQEAEKAGRVIPCFEELYILDPWSYKKIENQTQIFFDFITTVDSKLNDQHCYYQIETTKTILGHEQFNLDRIEQQLRTLLEKGHHVFGVVSTQSQLDRIRYIFEQRGILIQEFQHSAPTPSIQLTLGHLKEGFQWNDENITFYSENELLGTSHLKKNRTKSSKKTSSQQWAGLHALSDLSIGDAVVHRDHGIGKYLGLSRLDLLGGVSDFLLLEYANKDKLYLPIYRLNLIQKYTGAESAPLDRLGSQYFQQAKEKAKGAAQKLALDLLSIYAQRKLQLGVKLPAQSTDIETFETRFPFEETPDQIRAIDDVIQDLSSGNLMDRLICGDVGFGKTEVAIRAAYLAISHGKQVAVLVPTTILAHQHEQTFKSRFKDEPVVIESLTRFKTIKEQKLLLKNLACGKIDIIIGTHRLLSGDVKFSDLGLLIVDEEHRFGVEHKEKMKTLKMNTHILTLTATPIPRTLQMALTGIRDITLINTPPIDRLPIRTYVSPYDENTIKKAIEFELARGGQVFYLHNKVQNIERVAEKIQSLVPQARVVIAHGQMKERTLEDKINEFYHKSADVLVCTTIIESGIDLPSANTIIISRADTLGLAQLYQIRGRVGRGQSRGYAYLIIPSESTLSEDAMKRLEVIQKFVELGSGFHIASHDLEIRGGGDLLGPQQSGNINAVGFELFTELLEEAIQELQGKPTSQEDQNLEPEIKIPYAAFLSDTYIPNPQQKLSLYRRFSSAKGDSDLLKLEEELVDRFGSLPPEANNLIWLIRIKILLKEFGINTLTVGKEKVTIIPDQRSSFDPVRTVSLLAAHPDQYQLTPESKLIIKLKTQSIQELYFELEKILNYFSARSQHLN